MSGLQNRINNAKSLDEVCELLNDFTENVLENDESELFQDKLEHHVDLCGLPLFSNVEPTEMDMVFSYSDTHSMLQNTCTGDAFVIVAHEDE